MTTISDAIRVLFVLACCAVTGLAAEHTELALSGCKATDAQTTDASIMFRAGVPRPSGLQFDLEYDAAKLRIAAAAAELQNKNTAKVVKIRPGKERVLILAHSKSALRDGPVLTLRIYGHIEADRCATAVKIANASAVSKDGQAIAVNVTSGQTTARLPAK